MSENALHEALRELSFSVSVFYLEESANRDASHVIDAVGPLFAIPIVKNLDYAILQAIDAGGALDMRDWHTCKTTHCRAGWAIHLAGKDGKLLEKEYGPDIAGALIYYKSAGYVPDFYATNEKAMADMRRHAGAS